MGREVWQWEDEGTFKIYAENAGVQGALLYTGNFVRRVGFRPTYIPVRTEEPNAELQLDSYLDTIRVVCERAFLRKAADWPATIHVAGNRYQIEISLVNRRYTGIAPLENDTFTITGVVPASDDFGFPPFDEATIAFDWIGTGIS